MTSFLETHDRQADSRQHTSCSVMGRVSHCCFRFWIQAFLDSVWMESIGLICNRQMLASFSRASIRSPRTLQQTQPLSELTTSTPSTVSLARIKLLSMSMAPNCRAHCQ